MATPVVTIAYQELVRFSLEPFKASVGLLEKVGKAFGSDKECLGILAVTDVPLLAEKRLALLPLARKVALLEDKTEVESPESNYQTGWSHGKEIFAGKPDYAKGSFYANPLIDDITTIRQVSKDLQKSNPAFFGTNIWPNKSLTDLEPAFKDLGQLVIHVGLLLARVCDAFVEMQCPGFGNKLSHVLEESMFCKARLLHYFAIDRGTTREEALDDWCGFHNDHGSLTGLIPALFLDEQGEPVKCVDDKAGLYIQARNGSIHHVVLPPEVIAFQIGETSQIHSGGVLQATPHAVRGSRMHNVTRESFAVFMEPEYHGALDLPEGKSVSDVQDASIVLPRSVKTLASRWKPGMNFGEFSEATFKAFY